MGKFNWAVQNQPREKIALLVEDIDDAISGACNFVVPVSILERIGHVEFPPDPLHVERCEPGQ